MAIMEWACFDCSIWWERECPVGKAPDRTRCVKCNKLSERYFGNQGLNVKWGDDKDFHTVRARHQKVAEKGWDKTAADNFLTGSIQQSKDSQNNEQYRYKAMDLNVENMARDGLAKKVDSEERMKKKMESQKNVTVDAYNRANELGYKDIGSDKLDIHKPNKQ